MTYGTQHHFETLEDAHDFVTLLSEAVEEAKTEIQSDIAREATSSRRLDALRVAVYNLEKLELHVTRASRILNDLRTLRRLLFEERPGSSQIQPQSHPSTLQPLSSDSWRRTAESEQQSAAA